MNIAILIKLFPVLVVSNSNVIAKNIFVILKVKYPVYENIHSNVNTLSFLFVCMCVGWGVKIALYFFLEIAPMIL